MNAFEEVYGQYAQDVYRFLLKLSGDEVLAEDLLQDTFMSALIHIGSFEGRCSLYTWLCEIAKNAWLREIKRRKRFVDTPDMEILFPKVISAEDQVIREEEYRQVSRAVRNLQEPYLNVFVMRVFGDIPLKDIAELYGKSESWARVTFYRAKTQIQQEVSDENGL